MKQCPRCQQFADDYSSFCSRCGQDLRTETRPGTPPPIHTYTDRTDNPFDAYGPEGKCRGVAALFAILLGSLGIQYFYLGKTTAGLLSIVLSLVTCGIWQVITIIQGIMMFSMTNEQFYEKYVMNPATFPLF